MLDCKSNTALAALSGIIEWNALFVCWFCWIRLAIIVVIIVIIVIIIVVAVKTFATFRRPVFQLFMIGAAYFSLHYIIQCEV